MDDAFRFRVAIREKVSCGTVESERPSKTFEKRDV